MQLTVGLTGGIGSGKSTVARIFEQLGYPVFFADAEAIRVYDDPVIQERVRVIAGTDVFEQGTLNRQALASIVFADPEKLKALNALIHPEVARRWSVWKSAHHSAPVVLREAAILIESGSFKDCDEIIVVTAPEELRIQRVMDRDGVGADQVRDRMRRQMKDEDRNSYATHLVVNDDHHLVLPQILNMVAGWKK